MEDIQKPKWANSVVEFNHKFYECDNCGHTIKDRAWFSIRALAVSKFVFCSQLCEEIYTMKHRAMKSV